MKLDLPLMDVLSIYTFCYSSLHATPPELQEVLQPALAKMREQLAQHHEKDLLEIESYYQIIMANTHGIAPGSVH